MPSLRHHRMATACARNLARDETACVVYTPPEYDASRAEAYPLLVLLHGWTDSEWSWTEQGHLTEIADLLMFDGEAKSAVIAMPLGYGDGAFAGEKFTIWQNLPAVRANTDAFSRILTEDLLPLIDREYNVSQERSQRAIGGLSMGGLQAAVFALRNPEEFGTALVMSGAFQGENFGDLLRDAPLGSEPPVVRVRCGKRDGLLDANRKFAEWLHDRHVPVELALSEGGHNWSTWSDDLRAMLPRLFRPA